MTSCDKLCTAGFCAASQPHVPALPGERSEATGQEMGDLGFIGWPGLPSGLGSLLWECGKGTTR